ncbi:MAG: hypothetical protein AAF191_00865 [Verrucomicrobiota bacterium]
MNFLETADPSTLGTISWGIVSLCIVLCLALTVHHLGLKAKIRFSLLFLFFVIGFLAVRQITPGTDDWAVEVDTGAGITTEDDLVVVRELVSVLDPENIEGMLFHEDGQIEPILLEEPIPRTGNAKLYAVKFKEWVPGSQINKVVVFSGAKFEAEIGESLQSVEVFSSGDGDVLVITDSGPSFVDPEDLSPDSPIQVEEITLTAAT